MSKTSFITTRAVELRVAATDPNTFEGIACVFDVVDSYNTTFKAGCFTAGGLDTNTYALLWQHDPNRPIGVFHAEERSDGLYIVGKWDNSVAGQEARQAALGGSAGELSVGFRWHEDLNAAQGDITIAELMEVSQVTSRFGAVPGAALTAVRNAFAEAGTVVETPAFDEEETFEAEETVEEVETVEDICCPNCSDVVCVCGLENTAEETPADTELDAAAVDAQRLRARALAALTRI